MANALPQALILTAIVIGFAMSLFLLVLLYRTYAGSRTLDTGQGPFLSENPAMIRQWQQQQARKRRKRISHDRPACPAHTGPHGHRRGRMVLRRHYSHAGAAVLAGALIHFACAGLLLSAVMTEGVLVHRVGSWPAPAGICLVADLLSAVLVLVTAILHVAVVIHTRIDATSGQIRAGFYSFMQMLTGAICGAFLTGDLFNLYVWFEVMLMASFGIMVMDHPSARLPNAVKYVTLNIVATLFLLTGIGLVYGLTGTLNLADLHDKIALVENNGVLAGTSLILMSAFGIKSALFPLFFWLPAAYHTLPPGMAAFFGGLLTKVGVYALIRLFTLVFVTQPHITHTI